MFLQISQKFTGKHLCQSLWHRYFPVNFAKLLRTPFFTEQLWWLLMVWGYLSLPKKIQIFHFPIKKSNVSKQSTRFLNQVSWETSQHTYFWERHLEDLFINRNHRITKIPTIFTNSCNEEKVTYTENIHERYDATFPWLIYIIYICDLNKNHAPWDL